MAKTFWFYLIIEEMHILENTAKSHPWVMSTSLAGNKPVQNDCKHTLAAKHLF